MSVLTPEMIGDWLARKQYAFFDELLQAVHGDAADLPPMPTPSAEAVLELSTNAYLAQLAIIAFTYEQCLDDTVWLQGDKQGLPKLIPFLTRVHERCSVQARPRMTVDSPDFEPFHLAPCIVPLENLLGRLAIYYSSVFTGLAPLEAGHPEYREAVAFVRWLLGQLHTDDPLLAPIGLSYYYATYVMRREIANTMDAGVAFLALYLRLWEP